MVVRIYRESFGLPVVSARAGNVVGGGDFAQNREGRITGCIVDEDMFVAVFSEAQHQVAHALVNFADVAFLVIAGSDDADGFHERDPCF